MSAEHTESPGRLFPGKGEMARRVRDYPWASSPVGDPASWPESMRTALRICLTSRFPMIVWWAPDLRFAYNDAYLPLLGTKHPALARPGAEVWGDIWHIVGPMLESVLETGEATWSEDLLLPMDRHGYWEETYWTYSYSPIHDDCGTVRGAFTAVNETTERVVGERRLAALQDLGAQAGTARTVGEACGLVAAALERASADVPYAAVHLRSQDTGGLVLAASSPAGAGPVPLPGGPGGWPLEEVLRTGRAATVGDLAARFGELPGGSWGRPPTEAVVLPLPGETGAEPVGVIVLAASAGRALDEAYRTFLDLVAQHTAALVNGAVAYQVQQHRAEELAELDRAKTAFFSNISHEFRTPLTLIMGPVEELRAELSGFDEHVREQVEVIHRNGLRMGRLVTTLLDFSRIEAGRMQARYEPVDLSVFTAELASVFRSAVERAGLAFEVDCPPLPQPVHLDRGMWEKVVLNLLSNALKFTFDGAIRVALGTEDGRAVLRVSDTGTGIAAEEMPRLFERFHRIPNVRSRSEEGSGIGLALVQELVGLHGGTITADSVEGAGTVFTVRLPFGHAHLPADRLAEPGPAAVSATAEPFVQEAMRWLPRPSAAQEPPEGPPRAGRHPQEGDGGPDGAVQDGTAQDGGGRQGARVLVADDNADMREYLARLLEPRYRVTAVTDGLAALAEARLGRTDLVVSDVMMPGMGGLELVAALRADPRTAGIPVLLLSARAGEEASIEGLEAGADDYLVKPFSAQDLLARVRTNLELARVRNHHAGWRAAMVASLQEGFFVCDSGGAVVEINTAFTDILGYGPEGLPYPPQYPWWPAPSVDPEAHERAGEAYAQLMGDRRGSFTVPVLHRDGHRIWVAATFSTVEDPETGEEMRVGTVRDVTAERFAAQREAALTAMSVRLSQASSVPDAVRAALDALGGLWHTRSVLAVTWRGDGEPAVAGPDGGLRWQDLPEPRRRAVEALRGHPPLHPAVSEDPAGVGVTLDHPEGLLSLWLEPDPARPFGDEDPTLLGLLAGHLGQALRRAHQTDQQREVALTLQRAILGPDRLPSGFAVRYEPATRPLEVGGDWYDTVELPDGRIGIVVGDCVGRGLSAATVMGQLRSACRALLLQASGPAETLTSLDRFAALVPGALCTTVFCGILDPGSGRLVYSSAGHPPGILAHPDGRTELLEGGRSTPLAVRPGHPRPEAERTVPARSTLLLYTDGLVERRRRPLTAGVDQAAAAVGGGRGVPLEELAVRLMERLAPEEGYDDDVAFLLYRHPGPLEVSFPAESGRLAQVRGALREWLARCDLPPRQAQGVLVAAGEACANAIEHGHRDRPGQQVRLTATATADGLRLTVADSGRWKTPDPGSNAHRGRGLTLMRALMQQVTIDTGDGGTTVDMQTRIGR
ncbi:SpoIIE family protein phosphatase [Streptomyces sp. NPDC001380]|uniref:SpoIIE family protein phosphatase n=1 Tax=Streptomyces sp. NPDC001380 TaxID=3364566 RepID=UPI003694A518